MYNTCSTKKETSLPPKKHQPTSVLNTADLDKG